MTNMKIFRRPSSLGLLLGLLLLIPLRSLSPRLENLDGDVLECQALALHPGSVVDDVRYGFLAYWRQLIGQELRSHLNELPIYDWRIRFVGAWASFRTPPNEYGSTIGGELTHAIAKDFHVHLEHVVVTGGGSSRFIPSLADYALDRGKLICPIPNFYFFTDYLESHAKRDQVEYVTLEKNNGFILPPAQLERLLQKDPNVSMVILTNPNNPTGSYIDPQEYINVIDKYPGTIFVFDQAYLRFVDRNALELFQTFNKVVLIQTFSKGYGQAATRVGWLLAKQAELLKKMRPFNTDHTLTNEQEAKALFALRHPEFLEKAIPRVKKWTADLSRRISQLPGLEISPSATNFFMVNLDAWGVGAATALAEFLEAKNIRIRDLTGYEGLTGEHVRISSGTPSKNWEIIKAIEEFFRKKIQHTIRLAPLTAA